jgi:hypothetical protein
VLFIGNSMTLGHDLPDRVAARAAGDGMMLSIAVAAARGARLVETWRIAGLRALLAPDRWDIVVLQDLTTMPLRLVDRMGSASVSRRIAAAVAPAPVLLYPPPPPGPDSPVYRDAGFLADLPDSPADLARRSMACHAALAETPGIHLAPVPDLWLTARDPGFHAEDSHHLSAEGAEFVAGVLWSAMRDLLVT